MKKRTISAIIMLLIVIPLIIIGGIPFRIGVLLIGLIGFKELLNIKETKKKLPYVMKGISYILLTILILSNNSSTIDENILDYKVIALTLFTILIPLVIIQDNRKYSINDAMYLIGMLFFLGTAFNLTILIRNYSITFLIYLALITVITDTFAYITGFYVGKTKMCEKISPKKTWEGFVGGTFFGVLIPSMFYFTVINSNVDVIVLVACTTFLSLIGQAGDLVFSSIKRYFDKKDFSNLIPGHGGVCDRLDSIIFVLLGFVVVAGLL